MDWLHTISVSMALWVVLGIANFPIYLFAGRLFFPTSEDFWEAFKFSIQPDLLSLFTGEYLKDLYHSVKLSFFIACMTGLVSGEHYVCWYLVDEYVIQMDATLYALLFESF